MNVWRRQHLRSTALGINSAGSIGAADVNDFARLDFLNGQNASRKVLPEVLQTIG